jgi:hypothetical protein
VIPNTGTLAPTGTANGIVSAVPTATAPMAPNTASPNAPGLAGLTNAQATSGTTGSPTSAVNTRGVTAATPAGGGGAATPGPVGTINNPGLTTPGIVGPVSVFGSGVPSVPPISPTLNVALPPAVAKAPESATEVGAMREQGVRDLDAAAVGLDLKANEVDVVWSRFKSQCLGGTVVETTPGREWFLVLQGRVRTPTEDVCRAMHGELVRVSNDFEQQFNIASDAARQADVLPGTIRQIWARHRLDH